MLTKSLYIPGFKMADSYRIPTDEEEKRMREAAEASKRKREESKRRREYEEAIRRAADSSRKRREDNRNKDNRF